MYNDTKEWWKIWRGIDLSFQNWHTEFDEFWLKHSKVSKIWTLIGCFWRKCIMFELKRYGGIVFYDIGKWCKIWRWIELSVQNWHEEFNEFWPEHSKSHKNMPFNGLPLPKVCNVSAYKVKGSYAWWHWRLMKNLKGNWLVPPKITWGTW